MCYPIRTPPNTANTKPLQTPHQMSNIIHNIAKWWSVFHWRRDGMNNINVVPLNYYPQKSSIHSKFYGSSASKKFCFITCAHHRTTSRHSSHNLSLFILNNCIVAWSAWIQKYSCIKVQFVCLCWWWLPCIFAWLLPHLSIQLGLGVLEVFNILICPFIQATRNIHFSSMQQAVTLVPYHPRLGPK